MAILEKEIDKSIDTMPLLFAKRKNSFGSSSYRLEPKMVLLVHTAASKAGGPSDTVDFYFSLSLSRLWTLGHGKEGEGSLLSGGKNIAELTRGTKMPYMYLQLNYFQLYFLKSNYSSTALKSMGQTFEVSIILFSSAH